MHRLTRRNQASLSAGSDDPDAQRVAHPKVDNGRQAYIVGATTNPGTACMESHDNDGRLETWLVRVSGRVQGVGYRFACIHRARALGITGWVRNRMDESVEAMLQGSPQKLADMCDWLREGVPAAMVDELEVTPVPPPFQRFDRFDRLPDL
jgi:acylphosphatase